MGLKNGIGYSSLSGIVYLGKQNTKSKTWVGKKEDITSEFLDMVHMFFTQGTIRNVSCGQDENLIINIKKDKESIGKLIKALNEIVV